MQLRGKAVTPGELDPAADGAVLRRAREAGDQPAIAARAMAPPGLRRGGRFPKLPRVGGPDVARPPEPQPQPNP